MSNGKKLWAHIQLKITDLRNRLDDFQARVNELLPPSEDREVCVFCNEHTDHFDRLQCKQHVVCRPCLLKHPNTIRCHVCS